MKIDHITVCGDDLERMRQGFADIGLPTEYGGVHGNGLTHMALTGFEDGSYLELIAPVENAKVAKATGMMAEWMPLMLGNAGAGSWAVRVSGIHERAAELRSRGIEVRGPQRGGRTRPDGTQLEWETAVVGPGAAGSVLPFMIEDRTERNLRAQPSANELGITGVEAVVIGVRDLAATSALFRKAYEWAASASEDHPEFEARIAKFEQAGGPGVFLATPLDESAWLGERLRRLGEGAAAFLLLQHPEIEERIGVQSSSQEWFGQRIAWLRGGAARIGLLVGGH